MQMQSCVCQTRSMQVGGARNNNITQGLQVSLPLRNSLCGWTKHPVFQSCPGVPRPHRAPPRSQGQHVLEEMDQIWMTPEGETRHCKCTCRTEREGADSEWHFTVAQSWATSNFEKEASCPCHQTLINCFPLSSIEDCCVAQTQETPQ